MASAFQASAFQDGAFQINGGAPAVTSSGMHRLSVSSSWNIDRVQSLLSSVQALLGRVEQPKKPTVDFIKAPERPQTLDFIPVNKPAKAPDIPVWAKASDWTEIESGTAERVAELKVIEARLQRVLEDAQLESVVKEKRAAIRVKRAKARKAEIEEEDELLLLGL